MIASYNLSHSSLFVEKGRKPDWHYLRRLHYGAYPAVIEIQSKLVREGKMPILPRRFRLLVRRTSPPHLMNWRAWSFRWQRSYWVYLAEQNRIKAERFNKSRHSKAHQGTGQGLNERTRINCR